MVRNTEHKCKLSCFNRIKQSYYTTPENVLDGTPCSYDHPSDLCVQALFSNCPFLRLILNKWWGSIRRSSKL